jgi:hypothetical protein
MNEIKPTYVTFEQAFLLKEKGFDVEVIKYWNGIGEYFEVKDYFNWNQTDKFVSIPEHWQVIEWLRITHGIWLYTKRSCTIKHNEAFDDFKPIIEYIPQITFDIDKLPNFKTPQEAYSAALDYILKELI